MKAHFTIGAYLVAWLAGCVELFFVQYLMVVTRMAYAGSMKLSTFLDNSAMLFIFFLIGFVIDLPGAKVGIKRWNGLAIAFCITEVIVIMMNVGSHFDIRRVLAGGLLVGTVLAIVYFTTSKLGEMTYQFLDKKFGNG
ncbi:MAG: hypothetical protein WCI55_15455 [Armatimonadota bacterium]